MDKRVLARTLGVSVILGALVGFASDLFIRLLQLSSRLIWEDIVPHAQDNALVVIAISLAGGIGMGLCVKYFGENDGIGFEGVAKAVLADGELGTKQIKRVAINSYIGLITGASIGPESALVTIGGFMGDAVGRILKVSKQQLIALITISLGGSIGILLNSPVVGPIFFTEQPPTKDRASNNLLIFSSMVAASIGFAIYVFLKAPFLSRLTLVPAYSGFRPIDLMYGLLIGIIGTAIGLALKNLILKLKIQSKRFDHHPISRGTIVGLLIGLCGAVYPLVMFDGSAELSQLVHSAAAYSLISLLLLAAVRLVSTAVALSGGYQGGNIFPSIFICGAMGLAIHALCPFIPSSVAMVACMAPTMYVFLPLPLFSIFLFTEISSAALIPVMAMSLVSAYVLTNIIRPRQPSASPAPTPLANRATASS